MNKSDAVVVVLIGLLIILTISVVFSIYETGYKDGQVSVIIDTVTQTESLPKSGYFNITATITEYRGSTIVTPKPIIYKYEHTTDKGINLKFSRRYDIGTKVRLLGYKDSKEVRILSKEVIP